MDEKKLIEIIEKLRSSKREWKTVDAKHSLILKENGDKAEFIKDIAAMANNFEPSYLIIGLNDGSFSDIGPLVEHHTKNNINQRLEGNIDPPVIIDYQEFSINSNEYALIEIFGNNPPYIIARDISNNPTDQKKTKIYKGTIFVRHEDRTEGISRSELEELLTKGLRIEFKEETDKAKKLAFEQADHWEYLLTAELLKSRMNVIGEELDEIRDGRKFKKSKGLTALEFVDWSPLMLNDLMALGSQLTKVINQDFKVMWGEPGEPGNPIMIKKISDKLFSMCRNLLEWELEFRSTIVPDSLMPLKEMLAGWASHYILAIENIPDKLLKPFEEPNPSGQYAIHITIDDPPNTKEVQTEIEKFTKNPWKLLG